MSTAIEISELEKHFGDTPAIAGLSASIGTGRLTGLVGPDGAGKTTLMRLMAALMSPGKGSMHVKGLDITREARAIHHVTGYMPQRFGLYEDLSVMENLLLYATLNGVTRDSRAETFDRLLHFTRLAEFSDRLSGRLSGGMKQKLGLACALMARPEILLLDEPSVGVDPVSRQELWAMVQELVEEGMTVIWSTAYLDEAERCDEVLLLNEGRLVYQGAPAGLTSRIAGRSFRISGVEGDRRKMLTSALDLDCVRDGVIQGASVRLVLGEPTPPATLVSLVDEYRGRLEAATPRFEDAFIDLLGGGPGGHSAIAAELDNLPAGKDAMVECRHLGKRFGDFTAADDVSFSVQQGEIFGLLGPNGAGKSTIFKLLCGLLKPTSGSAEVAGFDLRHATSTAKLQLGYMAQKFSLYGSLSVRQNLAFFSGAYGLRGRKQQRRINEMIDMFELTRYLQASPDELPLGFKQRLALACALMHHPSVLFLDEPTSGVDPITRREFWSHITGLVSKGVTVLVTTHFMDEAEYCDRVALVNRSHVIALDSPDGLKAAAASDTESEPTMEEAFIRLIHNYEAEHEEVLAA